jgi:antitoxin (DNA-binding transcriptional repressor) of toxin-antitoxin stability system
MTDQVTHIDIESITDFPGLIEEVRATENPCVITRGEDEVAMLVPIKSRRPGRVPSRRRSSAKHDDSLLSIIGMLEEIDPDGATDVSTNKHEYLARAYRSEFS